jgi:hypothetical protein
MLISDLGDNNKEGRSALSKSLMRSGEDNRGLITGELDERFKNVGNVAKDSGGWLSFKRLSTSCATGIKGRL